MLVLLISMASFTSGASFAKRLFPTVGAEGATTLRLVGGALMLLVLMRPWRALSGKTGRGRAVVIYGLAMGIMNLLFYLALTKVPLGIAVALEFTGPLTVTIAMSRERADFLWIALAGAGLLLLLPLASDISSIDPIGAALAMGACVLGHIHSRR